MKVASKRTAIAALTVACVTLLSLSWSEKRGVSLGVQSAEAADQSTVVPLGVAGGARQRYRRSDRGYGLFAEAVAATTSPWIYDDYYCYGVAGRGYPPGGYYYGGYPGGYCVRRSDAAGLYARPTLFPRYYGSWGW